MHDPEVAPSARVRAALARGVGLFGFWLLLAGPGALDGVTGSQPGAVSSLAGDLVLGLLSAVAATWVSLCLLPPTSGRIHYALLARLGARFLGQSFVAGMDVARRAFDPRLPLRPGFLAYLLRIRTEAGRAVFGAYTSLMPGTLPVGSESDGAMVYHCLDLDQPISAGLAKDEALITRVRTGGGDK
jgi:multicomponent Na+:H+ antiporter subunit E